MLSVNGKIDNAEEQHLSARDRGFMLGDGIFETLLVVHQRAMWRNQHFSRMERTAHHLGIPFHLVEICNAVDEVLARSTSRMHVLRVSLSRGVTARGLAADAVLRTLVITCDLFDTATIGKPVTLLTSQLRRNPFSITDRFKTLSYGNAVHAAREAKSGGADDALMLALDGSVACTSISNLFVLNGRTLTTPPADSGILKGVMRAEIMDKAPHHGYDVKEERMAHGSLFEADGVFVTNSLRLACPVVSVDDRPLRPFDCAGFLDMLTADIQVQTGVEWNLIGER